MRSIFLLFLLLFYSADSSGEEFFILGGAAKDNDSDDMTYAWQLEYQESLGESFAASISYLNEGHVTNHHRDGNSMQLWGKTHLLKHRLSLAAGIGPFLYFDTTSSGNGNEYVNDHGLQGILSVSATWHYRDNWLFQIRTNWVGGVSGFDTVSVITGLGYQLEAPLRAPKAADSKTKPSENEVTLFIGETIMNSFKSESSLASGIEYRQTLADHLDFSIGWLNEGNNGKLHRNGISTELWMVNDFLADKLSLGIGAGLYVTFHHDNFIPDRISHKPLAAIMTMSAGYRLNTIWGVRTSWNRIITDYDKDSDVILGGISLCF
ncbi:hypothetical protein OR1_03951 [Geobacter sp. OR-1]|uniref:hypothetical protein n=1 Tax=Geobacter sp. OR-1 TaxID=1266765 RepID=UPI000543BC11|nr:hypothetical protein [Geobacter sp. OR-1]GAM11635.1 hypothetical protein OR1_03951 [Geobacter sp. OR-1]